MWPPAWIDLGTLYRWAVTALKLKTLSLSRKFLKSLLFSSLLPFSTNLLELQFHCSFCRILSCFSAQFRISKLFFSVSDLISSILLAPLMGEPSAKPSPTAGDSQRSVPTPFLTKTYQLVDDETIDHVISWNDDGSSFIVWNTMAFARDLLPKYFKHNNFTSFLRQLNTYGFRKVVSDRWEFANECFRKGKKQLLCEIQRRKLVTPVPSTVSDAVVVTTVGAPAVPSAQLLALTGSSSGEEQVISSNVTPTKALAELIDENDRLRKEKVQLTEQLVEVKSLCNNIFSLMSSFVENQFKSSFKVRESVLTSAKSLDLFPLKRPSVEDDEAETNQIGAAIGAKRPREYREGPEAAETAEDDTTLRLQPPDRSEVKSERINCQNKVDNQKTWHNQVH